MTSVGAFNKLFLSDEEPKDRLRCIAEIEKDLVLLNVIKKSIKRIHYEEHKRKLSEPIGEKLIIASLKLTINGDSNCNLFKEWIEDAKK